MVRRYSSYELAPAYDLTFARGEGWTRTHQMRVRDRTSGLLEEDLLAVADEFGVKRPDRVLDACRSALADWERRAAECGVPDGVVSSIRRELDARAEALAG